MQRRQFIVRIGQVSLGVLAAGCGASSIAGLTEEQMVRVYDVYAQALYFGGELGPLTGTITAIEIVAGAELRKEFWHGHGGVNHEFIVTPTQLEQLKRGHRVDIETTSVEDHTHRLFIDPSLPQYRVPGSQGIDVPATGGTVPTPPSQVLDADGDGIADDLDLCSMTPEGAPVHQSGEWTGCAAGQHKD